MKFAVAFLACLAVAQAQFGRAGQYNAFNKPQASRPQAYRPPQPAYNPQPAPEPSGRYVADARSAQTVKEANEVNPDGSYNYFFETDNGIAAQAQGTPRNFGGNPPVAPSVAQGSFSWTAPDGTPVVITYIADENGYQPSGNAIPTPPPVPADIQRALDYIARVGPSQ